jgi:hypothetical protein
MVKRGTTDQRGGNMAVPDSVNKFLNANAGVEFCDNCIQDQLKLKKPQQAQQAAKPLGTTPGFIRQKGKCSICGKTKTTTKKV